MKTKDLLLQLHHNLIPIIFLLLAFIYMWFRPQIFSGVMLVVAFILLLKKLDKLPPPKLFVYAAGTFYLFLSTVYIRVFSYDSLILYFRNLLLLADDFKIDYVENPVFPYPVEFFLALLLRFANLYMVNFAFGVATLGVLYTSWLIYKRLGFSDFVGVSGLLILIASPTFLEFALFEFKPDMFILLLVNLAVLQFLRIQKHNTLRGLALLGVLLSVSVLAKMTVVFFALPFILCILFDQCFIRKELIKAKLLGCVAFGVSFLLPLIFWVLFNGLNVPLLSKFAINAPKVSLTRNAEIVAQCEKESTRIAFDIYFRTNGPLWFLTQPYYYFVEGPYQRSDLDKANPGLFIYVAIFIFLFSYKVYVQGANLQAKKYLYISVATFIVGYFMMMRSIYWYLFPVYPLISILVPLYIEKYSKHFLLRHIFTLLLVSMSIIYAFGFYAEALSDAFFTKPMDSSYIRLVKDFNKYISDNTKDGEYILNTHLRGNPIFLTFVKDLDKKLIEGHYYFADETRSLDELYHELKDKNVLWLVGDPNNEESVDTADCMNFDNSRAKEFIAKYTVPHYPRIYPRLFKLK